MTARSPEAIFREYEKGVRYKTGMGRKGLYEQNRINERFFVGDQWRGVHCGENRPLVRHNIIKRIADYKMAVVDGSPLAVTYTADGVPYTAATRARIEAIRDQASMGQGVELVGPEEEMALVSEALSDYFRATAERLKLSDKKELALRNAYITGTGVIYTYWDDRVQTGLYADYAKTAPIRGDIACEVLDIENVYVGDPTMDNWQEQPYILIAQRRPVDELQREAKRRGSAEWRRIAPDRDHAQAFGEEEEHKATLLTRFWKEWDKDGRSYSIHAMQVCRGVVVRPEWDLGIRLYPLAVFHWERRKNCAYGDSEITYLIPNQIAINRMMTASVWAVMMMGMPIMVVNGDVVTQPVTNDPGQIVQVYGTAEDTQQAIRYVDPPAFSPQFDRNIESLISNTLTQAGASNTLLGDVDPDNAAAILAVREAALTPLRAVQSRFHSFCEDLARIWAEFWIAYYGKRTLKIEDKRGVWYLPFDGDRCRDWLLSVRVDVGAANEWSEERTMATLDGLLDREIITPEQYLRRLPKGMVADVGGLLQEIRKAPVEEEEMP